MNLFKQKYSYVLIASLLAGCGGGSDDATTPEENTDETINNQLQLVTSLPNQSIDSGTAFSYQIEVSDADDENNGQDITFELVSSPDGMTVSSTGLIHWQANVSQSSNFAIDIAINDGGEDATQTVNFAFSMDVLYYQAVTGRAVNYYTGEGLNDVDLSLFTGGNAITAATSDETGLFEFSVLDTLLENQMTLSATSDGYSEHSIIVNNGGLLQTQHIALLPSHVTTSFDSSLAKTVEYQEQSIVDFSAASLVREDGQAIDGQVTARVTIIDPSLDINVMPGDMVTMANAELVPIESFGAINVVLEDESGASVNLASNQQATINIPLAGNSANSPDTIPLYYFDEQQGIWIEEGEATKVTVGGETFYQGQVSHFTTWNADRVFETAYIHGCVVDSDNVAVSGARMISTGRDYNGSTIAYTDENGQFSLAAKTNSTVLISGSQGSQSRTLSRNLGSEDLTISECLVLSAATSTVKLTWGENPRDLDTHFYGPSSEEGGNFHLYFGNKEVTIDDTTIYLDVDDTSSYGPEILTIPAFPYAGRYEYVIKEYSGTSDILNSPTRVELNLESEIRIFSPPQGVPTRYWHVFDFVVSETGDITIETVNAWLDSMPLSPVTPFSIMPTKTNTISKKAIENKYYQSKQEYLVQ